MGVCDASLQISAAQLARFSPANLALHPIADTIAVNLAATLKTRRFRFFGFNNQTRVDRVPGTW